MSFIEVVVCDSCGLRADVGEGDLPAGWFDGEDYEHCPACDEKVGESAVVGDDPCPCCGRTY